MESKMEKMRTMCTIISAYMELILAKISREEMYGFQSGSMIMWILFLNNDSM